VAAAAGYAELVKLLLDHSAGLHNEDTEACAVRLAAARGHLHVMKVLVARGVNVTMCDNLALRLAAMNGHAEMVCFLVECGADVAAHQHCALRMAAGVCCVLLAVGVHVVCMCMCVVHDVRRSACK